MAIELLDEHEQGERVRTWLRNNGGAIVGGVAIGLIAIFGYQYYQNSQVEGRYAAASQFESLTDALESDDADAARAIGTQLSEDAPGLYGTLAALRLSELAFEDGDVAAAIAALEPVAGGDPRDPALAELVALRLARLELARGDAEAALRRLDAAGDDAFAGLAAEVRGDALAALDRDDQAADAYRQALQSLDASAPNRSLIEMKLADVGGAVADESAVVDAATEPTEA